MFQAVLCSKIHPEYGSYTMSYPAVEGYYDQFIKDLNAAGMGSAVERDCHVVEVNGSYSVLKKLEGTDATTDELDYLAKRLESFSDEEDAQFQAMAYKLALADIKDFINLTFACQQATVITDFSNLDRVGRQHQMAIHGGCMPSREYERLDGRAEAERLIREQQGTVTPYGAVYDNGMKLEQVYNGKQFPTYFYRPCEASVTLSRWNQLAEMIDGMNAAGHYHLLTDQGNIVEIFADLTPWTGIRDVIRAINANAGVYS